MARVGESLELLCSAWEMSVSDHYKYYVEKRFHFDRKEKERRECACKTSWNETHVKQRGIIVFCNFIINDALSSQLL